jgi:hypothetical protein
MAGSGGVGFGKAWLGAAWSGEVSRGEPGSGEIGYGEIGYGEVRIFKGGGKMRAIFEGMKIPGSGFRSPTGPFTVETFEHAVSGKYRARMIPTLVVIKIMRKWKVVPFEHREEIKVQKWVESLFEKKVKDWE